MRLWHFWTVARLTDEPVFPTNWKHFPANWNLDMLVLKERGKPQYPKENILKQRGERTTNWDKTNSYVASYTNPGHIGVRRVLSCFVSRLIILPAKCCVPFVAARFPSNFRWKRVVKIQKAPRNHHIVIYWYQKWSYNHSHPKTCQTEEFFKKDLVNKLCPGTWEVKKDRK